MRMFVGILLGSALTVAGVYVADHSSSLPSGTARPMVNWDVVAKNLDDVTTMAREGWRKLAG
jgi:hypothetical protein